MKKVTISDIASVTNCSISTVSKALSDSTDINSKTREEILRCAMQMGYRIGRKKANSKGKIAVVVQGSDFSCLSFEYQMLFNFSLIASTSNYDVEVIDKNSNDHSWNYEKEILEKDFCGAFILRLGDAAQIFDSIKGSALPLVIFDNEIEALNSASIGCDNTLGIKLAVDYMVSLGHKKIAFYGGTPTSAVSIIRKKSFIAALYAHGMHVYPELIAESSFSQNYSSSIIPDFVQFGVTAIVCASDWLASCCIEELNKLGKSVPKDISIIGFDNVPICEETTPKLTTIDQNIKEIGKQAFLLLENLINGVMINKILFKPKLIIRDSTSEILKDI